MIIKPPNHFALLIFFPQALSYTYIHPISKRKKKQNYDEDVGYENPIFLMEKDKLLEFFFLTFFLIDVVVVVVVSEMFYVLSLLSEATFIRGHQLDINTIL